MAAYSINVRRGKKNGTLTYSGGAIVSTTCWWDPVKKIPAGTYTGCSATTMAKKKNSSGQPREAIFLPNVPGFKGIFIHMGTGPGWSDGCVVIVETEILRIYNDILPKNGKNVTVIISDE
jgi:hypothetical protein